MAVPKCKGCNYRKSRELHRGYEHYCIHPEASKTFRFRDIWTKEMGKTSPKWCPLRKGGNDETEQASGDY